MIRSRTTLRTLRAAALTTTSLCCLLAASPAFAQEAREAQPAEDPDAPVEIVVTATLRETSLLDVPFSINAQTEADIQRSNATTRLRICRATSPASPSRISAPARARSRCAACPRARSSAISRA